DVKSTVNYIRNTLQAPAASERLKDEIKRTYKNLKQNPFMYPVVPSNDLASMGFRFIMVKNYMLFYIVEEKQVNIIRFLYGRRNWINILKETNIETDL
ncbi:MAG: type II toxin-antitoxin system RelE/ParE family toxin, partial [Treponema sp.]|nr:type II toxin-antitoxin system RelE/ParE family toxin [Treponema sp.]